LIQQQVEKIEALTNPTLQSKVAKAEEVKQKQIQAAQAASFANLEKKLAAFRIAVEEEGGGGEEEEENFD
jgi:hypothetical protein